MSVINCIVQFCYIYFPSFKGMQVGEEELFEKVENAHKVTSG